MHHRQQSVWFQVTFVVSFSDRIKKHSNGVVSSSTSGGIRRNYARESQTSKIGAELVVVIFSHEFGMDFRDSVNRSWSLNCEIWCWITWRILKEYSLTSFKKYCLNINSIYWSKSTNCRWNEDSQFILLGKFNHVMQSFNVDTYGK